MIVMDTHVLVWLDLCTADTRILSWEQDLGRYDAQE